MVHYIIDGNNVIGKVPELFKLQKSDKQRSREQLVYLLQRYFHNKKINLTLHFDGFANIPLPLSKGKIIYSENKTADSLIKENIERIKNRKNIILVTSDNELRISVKHAAAQ
jgi:predicted RNA-binding protein with PIN domain